MSESTPGTPPPANVPNTPPNNSSEPPSWYTTPPAWLNNAPQGNISPPPGVQRNSDLMNAIGGMPDRVVDAIREAFPQQAPSTQPAAATPPPAENAAPAGTPAAESTPGKSNNFADWWFGR
jgi:hypothetical protein